LKTTPYWSLRKFSQLFLLLFLPSFFSFHAFYSLVAIIIIFIGQFHILSFFYVFLKKELALFCFSFVSWLVCDAKSKRMNTQRRRNLFMSNSKLSFLWTQNNNNNAMTTCS
jgi:hypothetical protein